MTEPRGELSRELFDSAAADALIAKTSEPCSSAVAHLVATFARENGTDRDHELERPLEAQRDARLDTVKPGTGLGLAIVRDVAEIYGDRITLEESEDLGGLLARLTLPAG